MAKIKILKRGQDSFKGKHMDCASSGPPPCDKCHKGIGLKEGRNVHNLGNVPKVKGCKKGVRGFLNAT